MTSQELAALVAMPVYRIRTLTRVADLDQRPVATLRTLATKLHLPLPAWLTPHESWPDLCAPDSLHDPVLLQAVLLTAQGQHLYLSEIAQVLAWDRHPGTRGPPPLSRLDIRKLRPDATPAVPSE